ncbi:MAG: membrane protein insertase YidC [Acidimicrobiia bacterium]
MLDPIYNAIGWLLAQYYSVIPNLGVAIILLTFTIMLLLYPLTAKQAKSMIAMQRVQPEIKKLQAKYKNDRQKLNEEMMKFYQENKINPLAGCLPLLVQLPIFFALFTVLRDSYKYVPVDSGLYADLCSKGGELLNEVACGKAGVNPLQFLSMDLTLGATDPHGGIIDALPYFILVALVILTGFLQTRQAQKRTPVANKQMAMVMKVLPIFFGLISLQFPSGLVLYFFVSNLWRLGQQEVIFRSVGTTAKPASGKGDRQPVLEVEGRDTTPEAPAERAPKPPSSAAKRQASAAPAPSPETPPVADAPRSGVRGLFQLPPPPEVKGQPRAQSAQPGARPKPPPSRNRSKKKKRRR